MHSFEKEHRQPCQAKTLSIELQKCKGIFNHINYKKKKNFFIIIIARNPQKSLHKHVRICHRMAPLIISQNADCDVRKFRSELAMWTFCSTLVINVCFYVLSVNIRCAIEVTPIKLWMIGEQSFMTPWLIIPSTVSEGYLILVQSQNIRNLGPPKIREFWHFRTAATLDFTFFLKKMN